MSFQSEQHSIHKNRIQLHSTSNNQTKKIKNKLPFDYMFSSDQKWFHRLELEGWNLDDAIRRPGGRGRPHHQQLRGTTRNHEIHNLEYPSGYDPFMLCVTVQWKFVGATWTARIWKGTWKFQPIKLPHPCDLGSNNSETLNWKHPKCTITSSKRQREKKKKKVFKHLHSINVKEDKPRWRS